MMEDHHGSSPLSGLADMTGEWDVVVRRAADGAVVFSRRFTQPQIVVGRRQDCDVCLADPSVAARHLYLQQLPGRILAIDLGSPDFGKRRGVLGRPGRAFVDQLRPGESVQVGLFLLSIGNGPIPTGDDVDFDRPLPQFSDLVASWELTNAKEESNVEVKRHVRHEITLIGRGPLCRFRIRHDSISTVHASLVYAGGQLSVVDLCSRYGVQVNREIVKSAILRDGDELIVGECRGTIRFAKPATPPHDIPSLAALKVASSEPKDADTVFDFHDSRDAEPAPQRLQPSDADTSANMSIEEPDVEVEMPSLTMEQEFIPDSNQAAESAELIPVANPLSPGSQPGDHSGDLIVSMICQLTAMQQQMMLQTQLMLQTLTRYMDERRAAGEPISGSPPPIQMADQLHDEAITIEPDARDAGLQHFETKEETVFSDWGSEPPGERGEADPNAPFTALSKSQKPVKSAVSLPRQQIAQTSSPSAGNSPVPRLPTEPTADDRDLQGWLNRQLAGLDEPQENRMVRLWKRLTGGE